MKPRAPNIENHGIFAMHDQACAVHHEASAVYDCNTGVFHPSWRAQSDGWQLVQAKHWWQRVLLRIALPQPDVKP
jgi:hypothetical protein